jgi:hypothetical protein
MGGGQRSVFVGEQCCALDNPSFRQVILVLQPQIIMFYCHTLHLLIATLLRNVDCTQVR